jgi:anti-sigma regulatory factor (Ser/Thr protein kinase)
LHREVAEAPARRPVTARGGAVVERFAPERGSPRRARRFVAGFLEQLELDGDCRYAAELLVSELVTNALLHARSATRVEVSRTELGIKVVVHDESPALPALRRLDEAYPAGRGLLLVDRIAHAWGVERTSGGKAVWFELRCAPGAG